MKKIIIILISILMLAGCTTNMNSINDTDLGSADTNIDSAGADNSGQVPTQNEQQSDLTPEFTSQQPDDITNTPDPTTDDIINLNSPFEKGYYDYQGNIGGNMPVQMSIYQIDGGIVVGTYFYESQRNEIRLVGEVRANSMEIREYDEADKLTGLFTAAVNTIDKIEGTWRNVDNTKSYPFSISLKSHLPGVEYGKRYENAVVTHDDKDVEDFAAKIRDYIINDNKEQLAKEILYPISVNIEEQDVEVKSEENFIKNYDKIFTLEYKQEMGNAFTKYLFSNWKGIMFGTGLNNIWINEITPSGGSPKLMITAINNQNHSTESVVINDSDN